MTTYYVDAVSGDDSNDGTAQDSAWKTLTHVNNQPFPSGDEIKFCRDSVFDNSLRITNVAGLLYGAYGSGMMPSFDEIRVSASSQITLFNLSCSGALLYNVKDCEVIGIECHDAYGNGLEIKQCADVHVLGGRFYDNGHVRSGGDKIGHGIFVGGGDGAGPIVIERARCYANKEDGIQFGGNALPGNVVTGCMLFDNGEDGIDSKGGTHCIEGNTISNNAQRAVGLHQNTRQCELTGNVMYNNRYALTVADGASVVSKLNQYTSLIRSAVLLLKTAASCSFDSDVFAVADPNMKAVDDQSAVAHVFKNTETIRAYNWMQPAERDA